jgi:hypothetical protein
MRLPSGKADDSLIDAASRWLITKDSSLGGSMQVNKKVSDYSYYGREIFLSLSAISSDDITDLLAEPANGSRSAVFGFTIFAFIVGNCVSIQLARLINSSWQQYKPKRFSCLSSIADLICKSVFAMSRVFLQDLAEVGKRNC